MPLEKILHPLLSVLNISNLGNWNVIFEYFLRPRYKIRRTLLNKYGAKLIISKLSSCNGKINRIKNEIITAAQNGEVYHLWWHPHNFGIDSEGALKALNQIISVYKHCAETYGMESQNMRELAIPYLIE